MDLHPSDSGKLIRPGAGRRSHSRRGGHRCHHVWGLRGCRPYVISVMSDYAGNGGAVVEAASPAASYGLTLTLT